MITLEFISLYHYWGNLSVMADIIAILAASGNLGFVIFYTNIFWKQICDLLDTFETNSIFCSELVRSNPKHMKIINDTLNRTNIYKKAIFMFINLQPIFYVLPTLIHNVMTSDEEILQATETVDGFTKYFPLIVWLPPIVKQEIFIRVMYGLQCIFWYEMCLFSATIFPFYVVLFLFTGTQFKLISSIIREMDKEMCGVENPYIELHEVPEQIFTADRKNLSTEGKLRSIVGQSSLQNDDIIQHSERVQVISSPEIKSTARIDTEVFYLRECITLHQASIK
jgi:hypothetical protein